MSAFVTFRVINMSLAIVDASYHVKYSTSECETIHK